MAHLLRDARPNSHLVISVSDAQTVEAMRLTFDLAKLVVEPSGALSLAAALSTARRLGLRRVGIILCGGNVDLSLPLPWMATTLP
mmetsp:Transcript_21571/g.50291  ORF Transcript_21571/g.50291 Transcript_21571/m.50291 type:complete len:85 (-) Transcript_21571:405-659(-)